MSVKPTVKLQALIEKYEVGDEVIIINEDSMFYGKIGYIDRHTISDVSWIAINGTSCPFAFFEFEKYQEI